MPAKKALNYNMLTAGMCGLSVLAPVAASLINPLAIATRPTILIPFYDVFAGLGIFNVLLAVLVTIACLLTVHFFGKTGVAALRILLLVLIVGWALTTTTVILSARINWDNYHF